jgi:hypothetical protein
LRNRRPAPPTPLLVAFEKPRVTPLRTLWKNFASRRLHAPANAAPHPRFHPANAPPKTRLRSCAHPPVANAISNLHNFTFRPTHSSGLNGRNLSVRSGGVIPGSQIISAADIVAKQTIRPAGHWVLHFKPNSPIMSVEYLQKYLTDKGFDLPRLLNDDFFQPIRLLFNHGHYVSATKLLMNFIDSVGFIELGDTGENTFLKWLGAYAELTDLDVTGEELWEHRNSLLHMSNLDSRKVISGKVKRLMSYVGTLPPGFSSETVEAKYYNLFALIQVLAVACSRWSESYNHDRDKFEKFLDRYDLIVSDNRLLRIDLSHQEEDGK